MWSRYAPTVDCERRSRGASRSICPTRSGSRTSLFTFDKGPKLLEFERQLGVIEAERKIPRLETGPSVLSTAIETMKAIGEFNSRNRDKLAGGGGGTGAGLSGATSSVARSANREATRRRQEVNEALKDL